MPWLRRINSEEQVLVELAREFSVLGRSENCDISVQNHSEISREHCGVRVYKDGVVTVTDFGSRNGTQVNGRQIFEETKLRPGDIIRLCRGVEFLFEAGSDEGLRADDDIDQTTVMVRPELHRATDTAIMRTFDTVDRQLSNRDFGSLMKEFSRQAKIQAKIRTLKTKRPSSTARHAAPPAEPAEKTEVMDMDATANDINPAPGAVAPPAAPEQD